MIKAFRDFLSTKNDEEFSFDSDSENSVISYSTSTCQDSLYFFINTDRNTDIDKVIQNFIKIYNKNQENALKLLYNLRDIRTGKGEKFISRVLLFVLKLKTPNIYYNVLNDFVDKYGSWKDVLFIYDLSIKFGNIKTDIETDLFVDQIKEDKIILDINGKKAKISLAAKWIPSEGSYYNKKPLKMALEISQKMNLSEKEYRKLISRLRRHLNIIETRLSNQDFENINFSHIPFVAHKIYRNVFKRDTNSKGVYNKHREDLMYKYNEYLYSLKKGKTKINSYCVNPCKIVKYYMNPNSFLCITVENQWKNIVNDIKRNNVLDKTMAVLDVSYSINRETVAIALGILLSQCTSKEYKNKLINFHESPSWINFNENETLYEKIKKVSKISCGENMNIYNVFKLILDHALKYELTQKQMIEKLFIFTDMKFNSVNGNDKTPIQKIKYEYNIHGYKLPKIICWNLKSCSNFPFESESENVICLSGFSQNLLTLFMKNKDFTPLNMLKTILDKYNVPTNLDENNISFNKNLKPILEKIKVT